MSWLELSLNLRSDQQRLVESSLEEVGALAITLLDADADTSNEDAILEPALGDMPLWPTVTLTALFDASTDRSGLLHVLRDLLPELAPEQIQFRDVADQDWTRAWMDQFQPMRFGVRLWIYPSTIEPPPELADAAVVRLDPGLAFGTGTHPTTAMCLQWLDATALTGKTVIDFGCGSGVLGIAALKLGAAHVIGVDNDPQALTASADNAERNAVATHLALFAAADFHAEPADVLVANILAGPLAQLAAQFATLVKPGGGLALSGILDGQQDELLGVYSQWFDSLQVSLLDGWVRIDGRRRPD